MQRVINRPNFVCFTPRRAALGVALAAGMAATGSVKAQVLVTDVASNVQTTAIAAFQKGAAYAKQVEEALTLVNQLQQMISTINTVISNPIGSLIPSTTTMTTLDPATIASLVQAKCNPGGGTGNFMGAALGAAVQALNLNRSFAQQQQDNCTNIVMSEADQYNATVDLYKMVPELHNSMSAVTSLMSQLSNFGDTSKATSQSVTLLTNQQQLVMDWNTRVTMDKKVIDTLNAQQSGLAAAMMNSRPSLVGNIVQATALAAAFRIDR